jgi:hypothetical protein
MTICPEGAFTIGVVKGEGRITQPAVAISQLRIPPMSSGSEQVAAATIPPAGS